MMSPADLQSVYINILDGGLAFDVLLPSFLNGLIHSSIHYPFPFIFGKIDGKVYICRISLTNINQLLSFISFITICLKAMPFLIEPFCLIIFKNVVRAFLCTTASRGRTPRSERDIELAVLFGRPCICFRNFLRNFSRHSTLFLLSNIDSSPYSSISTTKVDHIYPF